MAESSRRTSDTAVQPHPAAMPADIEKGPDPPSPPPPIPPTGPPGSEEAEKNFQPKTFKFWSVIVSVFLGLFIVALDRTILGTATPKITQEFNSLGDIGWYGSAYQLTTAASQLVFGRVYKFYSIKGTFLCSVAIFEIGSIVCAAAPNSIVFIVGRAIAGLGGAGIFTGCSIVMTIMIPLRKRPKFMGAFGAVFGLASVMGPLVGGAFTEGVTWRWCFWINLPVGAVAALALIVFLHTPTRELRKATIWRQITRLDPLGTFFFVPSIVCLILALQWGGSTYSWDSWRIILLLVLFGVLFVAFAAVQVLMPNTATVPVRIIRQRSILAGAIFMFSIAGSMLMVIYFLPVWFQVVQGASPVQSGVYTLPFVLSLVVGSILSGAITGKIGYYVPSMIACPAIMAVGQGLMSTFSVGESSSHWIAFQFVAGIGLGLGMQASTLAAQAVLKAPDIPTGIAIMFFSQQLGGGIFTSVGQNILSTYLVSHLSNIPGLDPNKITSEGAGDAVSSVSPEYQPIIKTVYNQAITKIFLCAMGIALAAFIASLFMEWKNVKKSGPPAPSGVKPSAEDDSKDTAIPASGSEQSDSLTTKPAVGDTAKEAQTIEKMEPRVERFKRNSTPAPVKSSCDHCEHCRLSRAITLAPSEQLSRWSRQSLTYGPTSPSPIPVNQATGAVVSNPMEEAARLATIARDAVAQLEELTRPFSISGTSAAEGSSGRRYSSVGQRGSNEEMRVAVPPRRSSMTASLSRKPTTQELIENTRRLSAQLDREERESRSRESLRQSSSAHSGGGSPLKLSRQQSAISSASQQPKQSQQALSR
ncbi:major facilitator superfamily domain-containing protein [Xylariomycetidae sp. FL2044]|nr:major facilitator superfamily domain-containing protein [Xylariomycetidae sp. FL2044]